MQYILYLDNHIVDSKKIFILTHGSDPDGIGSAALIRKRYGVPLENVYFLDYTQKKFDYAVNSMSKKFSGGITLFIADTGLDAAHVSSFESLVKRIKNGGGRVFWFDHHPWKEDHIKRVAKLCDFAIVGENKDACATEIIQRELGLEDEFSIKLAKLVHKTDFAHTPPLRISDPKDPIQIYNFVYTYYHNFGNTDMDKYTKSLRRIVGLESEGKLFDSKLYKDAKRFEKYTHEVLDYIKSHTYKTSKNIAVGFGKSVNSNQACQTIWNNAKCDIVVYVNITNNKGHIRSKKADIEKLANYFGGGGHPHAAGFNIDPGNYGNFSKESERRRLMEKIAAAAKNCDL